MPILQPNLFSNIFVAFFQKVLPINMFVGVCFFLVFYIIAVIYVCVCQTIGFSVEWVQFRLIYNLLPSYKICFHIFLFVCLLFVDFIKWICMCVSLNLFLLTLSTWYILIYIGYVLKHSFGGRKYTINNRPSISRNVCSFSLQSHDKIMINKNILTY